MYCVSWNDIEQAQAFGISQCHLQWTICAVLIKSPPHPLLLSATNGVGQGYLQCLTEDLKYTECRIKNRKEQTEQMQISVLVSPTRRSQALTNLNPIFRWTEVVILYLLIKSNWANETFGCCLVYYAETWNHAIRFRQIEATSPCAPGILW